MTIRRIGKGLPSTRASIGVVAALALSFTGSTSVFANADPISIQAGYVAAYERIDPGREAPRQSDYVYDMVMAKGGSQIPVLLPYTMTDTEQTAAYHRLSIRVSPESYTGIVHEPGLDIVITGSTPRVTHQSKRQNYNHGFRSFDDRRGGLISFGWSGADYEVKFHCRGLNEPGHGNCVSSEKAEGFVKEMLAGN